MTTPRSTYRLQVRESFDLEAVADVADYVATLGADWLYLSPLLKAEEGSEHGYDVVDHSQIDGSRGGAAGLQRASSAAATAGLGILVDIVPNHMGVATPQSNAWWWDVLKNGRESLHAQAFDIDWEAGADRIRIPILGDDAEAALTISNGQLCYHEHRFPIANGTGDAGNASAVHDAQHYELVHWRRADADLNYRRFFAVNSLAAIRVELPTVFDDSHREILRWVRDGLVQGLRVDHPDGLADPGAYLDRLRGQIGSAYLIVEKILEPGEKLPLNWPVAGTTGYDALGDFDRILVEAGGCAALHQLESSLHARVIDWSDQVHDSKRAVADGILQAEVLRITRLFPEFAALDAADAIAELFACFEVYRSYLPIGIEDLQHAGRLAIDRRPDLSETIKELLPILSDPAHPAAVRFQQTSGMVMAKGVEDSAFYRYGRLTSLNEVGGDPSEFSIDLSTFHSRQQSRQAAFPDSLTTLSSHDTKRSEDVRARINVISELPCEWADTLTQLHSLAPLGDRPFENLLWQAVVGAWPASRGRLQAYAVKAAREGGVATSWANPSAEFEGGVARAIDASFDDDRLADVIEVFVDSIRHAGWCNSLAAKVMQLTAPGVPDVYQGSELWDFSLVDPDNRRRVDFELRRKLLAEIDRGLLPPLDSVGAAKMLVTSRALRLRRDHPRLFSRYLPIQAIGNAANHVIAFDRGGAMTVATRLPIGLAKIGGWGDTALLLSGNPVMDVITGQRFTGGKLPLSQLLEKYPVALLKDNSDA